MPILRGTQQIAVAAAPGSITNAMLAPMPAETIKANITSGSATPTDVTEAVMSKRLDQNNQTKRSGCVREAWNMMGASSIATGAALTTAQEYEVALEIFAGETVTSITFLSGTTGYTAGTSPFRFFVLRSSAGAVLAKSANDGATAWAANSEKTLAMAVAFPVVTTGLYYLCASCKMTGGTHNTYTGVGGGAGNTNVFALAPIRVGLTAAAIDGADIPTDPLTITAGTALPWCYFS